MPLFPFRDKLNTVRYRNQHYTNWFKRIPDIGITHEDWFAMAEQFWHSAYVVRSAYMRVVRRRDEAGGMQAAGNRFGLTTEFLKGISFEILMKALWIQRNPRKADFAPKIGHNLLKLAEGKEWLGLTDLQPLVRYELACYGDVVRWVGRYPIGKDKDELPKSWYFDGGVSWALYGFLQSLRQSAESQKRARRVLDKEVALALSRGAERVVPGSFLSGRRATN